MPFDAHQEGQLGRGGQLSLCRLEQRQPGALALGEVRGRDLVHADQARPLQVEPGLKSGPGLDGAGCGILLGGIGSYSQAMGDNLAEPRL